MAGSTLALLSVGLVAFGGSGPFPPADAVATDQKVSSRRESAARASAALEILGQCVTASQFSNPQEKAKEYTAVANSLMAAEESKYGANCRSDDCDRYRLNRCKQTFIWSAAFRREIADRYCPEWLASDLGKPGRPGTLWADARVLPPGTHFQWRSPEAAQLNCSDGPPPQRGVAALKGKGDQPKPAVATSNPLRSALAQSRDDGPGLGACAACSGIYLAVIAGFFALGIALLVWVNKDAKRRGMDNPVLWMIVVMFTNVVGLIVYLLSRPSGDLVPCPHCSAKRLATLTKCPHCGAS